MLICGFEKFSMVDYDDKIACTVFTGGCNFRCPFCHNAPLIIGDADAFKVEENEVFNYLEKRKGLVDAVCVTGGEATLQPDLEEFYVKVKKLGDRLGVEFLTKLDTNGTRPEVMENLLNKHLLDYVAMDVKNSKAKYPPTAGVNDLQISKIERSVEILKASDVEYEFRTTLISEFHTERDMLEISEWIKGAKRYFLQKYHDNEGCLSHGFTEVPKDLAEGYAELFKGKAELVKLRGY